MIPPQLCTGREEDVTSFMRPAPHPNDDEIGEYEDQLVADPLSEETEQLLNRTARINKEIFTEIFRPIPTNFIRSWSSYAVS